MQQRLTLLKQSIAHVNQPLDQALVTDSRRKSLSLDWVIPNRLAIGPLPRPGDSAVLAQANIQTVLSLCAQAEGTLPEDVVQQFHCSRFILPDSHYMVGLQSSQLATVVEMIHNCLDRGEVVYVHCLAGVERSPTACIAYLCQHHQLELWEAVNCLKQAHPKSMPTDAQLRVVKDLVQPQPETAFPELSEPSELIAEDVFEPVSAPAIIDGDRVRVAISWKQLTNGNGADPGSEIVPVRMAE